jgi:predicted aspartyl protease
VDLAFGTTRARVAPSGTGAAAARTTAGSTPAVLRDVAIARRLGTLLALRARLGDVEFGAILDTGAQRSIGNLALARALRLALETGPDTAAVVRGADGRALAARQLETPGIRLGATTLPAQPLLYADLPVFASWRWQDRPALLLGMDLLVRLSRLQVDYPRHRVAIAVDRA